MEQISGLDNQQERREAAIRLAAFFEGEGTFVVSIFHRKNGWYQCTPVIRVGNCDPEAIQEMQRILTLHNVGHRVYLQKKYKPGHAQMGVLGIEGFKRVKTFLFYFGSFFFGRKRANVKLFQKYLALLEQADHRSQREQRGKLVEEFKKANQELNRLGVSRFLIDYTPNAIERRYSQTPLEN